MEDSTKIVDLIGYLDNRFAKADPGDIATSDRLAWFSYGYMHSALGPTIGPPVPPGTQISATWVDLGRLVYKWNHEKENQAVAFSMVQGPVTKQNL
jgi:hypothetical protein